MVLILLTVLIAQPAPSQERLLGLLALPGVFGEGTCQTFQPASPTLYADAGATRVIGTINVDRMWSPAPQGGCDGLEVSVHEGQARSALPTLDYDYDAPGAIVVDRRGGMFKIRLSGNRSGWVSAMAAQFMSYESLLEEFTGVTFFTDVHDGVLRASPGAPVTTPSVAAGKPGQPARVIATRRQRDRLWLQVEVLSHSMCAAAASGPPDTVAAGWLPAHAAGGEPTVWFASRGC